MEKQGYVNITYMVVNNREEQSQKLHHLLNERLINITLYAQDLSQPDVWQTVNAEKDDILVYDRCGRLTYHLSLPYTILSHPHVEEAITHTYCDGICGECNIESSLQLEECKKSTDVNTPTEEEQHHHHEHHGHREHGHHEHGHHEHHHGSAERHRHGGSHHHHHHHHHHHGQQQVDVGQQILTQIDFGQVAVEQPAMKRP